MAARFWVSGGTGNWSSTTNWSASSGGASGASAPSSADTATFNASSGAGTATVDSNVTIQTLTMTGFTGTLAFGTNTITLNSSGTVYTGATTFSVTGTPLIIVDNPTATATTISTTAVTEANSISFNIISGTYTLSFLNTAGHTARSVDFTGFAGTWTSLACVIYGSLTISTGMSITATTGIHTFGSTSATVRTITSNGKTLDFPITFNGVGGTFRLADALAVGATRILTLTNGTLDGDNKTISGTSSFTMGTGVADVTIKNISTALSFSTTSNSTLTFGANNTFSGIFTQASGIINLGSYTLNCGVFISSAAASRTINFGTGNITCSAISAGTIFNFGASGTPVVTGTPVVNVTYSGSSAAAVTFSGYASSFSFSAGTYALTLTVGVGSGANNIDFTGFAGSVTFGQAFALFGNLTLSTGMSTITLATGVVTLSATSGTQTITSNGKTCNFAITQNGVGGTVFLADALTMGATRALVLTNGTLDGNNKTISGASSFTMTTGSIVAKNILTALTFTHTSGTITQGAANTVGPYAFTAGTLDLASYQLNATTFTSANSNVRNIVFGTGNITLSGSGAIWNTFTATNFTATGSKTVNVSYSGATASSIAPGPLSEANSINFNVTAGTYTITTFNNATNYFGSLNFQGFAGSAPTVGALSLIYGNLTLGTTIASFGTTGTTVTFATTGTQVITSNGKTFNSKIIINGVGGTMRIADALTMASTVDLALVNGILDLNGMTLTVGAVNGGFATYLTGTRSILFNGGTLVCPFGGSNAFANNQPTGFTTSAGTGVGKISFTAAATKQMLGGGSTYNCTVSNDGAGALTIADSNTITTVTTTSGNVAITGSNTITTITNAVQPVTFTFTAGTTQTITNWSVSGTAGNLVTIQSATAFSHTLSKPSGTVSADYLSISRSTATGGAAWYAGANSTNGGNNLGWIFTGPPAGSTGAFFFMF